MNKSNPVIAPELSRIILLFCGIAMLQLAFADIASAQNVPHPQAAAISQYQERISALRQAMERLGFNIERQRREYDALLDKQAETYRRQDVLGVSSESFAEILKTLQSQRVQMMIDLAGLDARQKMLIAIQDADTKNKLASETIQYLEQLVALQQDKNAELKKLYNEGSVTQGEVRTEEMKLIEAKARLAVEKNLTKSSTRVQNELLDVALDRAEKQARLDTTENLLKTITNSRETLTKNQELENTLEQTRGFLSKLKTEKKELQNDLESTQWELNKLIKKNKSNNKDHLP